MRSQPFTHPQRRHPGFTHPAPPTALALQLKRLHTLLTAKSHLPLSWPTPLQDSWHGRSFTFSLPSVSPKPGVSASAIAPSCSPQS